jgi:hypothetical protein
VTDVRCRPLASTPRPLAAEGADILSRRVQMVHETLTGLEEFRLFIGASGIGREKGIEAINEYTETKSVFVELTGGTRDPFRLG